MSTTFTFRCYACHKTLRATRQKAGAIVKCPKCQVELIVPEPLAKSSSEAPADLLDLDPADIRVEPGSESVLISARSSIRDAEPKPVEDAPAIVAVNTEPSRPSVPIPEPEEEDTRLPSIQLEPQTIRAPRTRVVTDRSYQARPRDISLPRAAVVAWSLFLPLALILAFMAGLLAGHFLWVVKVVPAS